MKFFAKLNVFIFIFLITTIMQSTGDEKIIPERVLGNKDAAIVIEEFASMSCGHCANFHNTILPDIKKEFIDTGKAKLIFNDFPLDSRAMIATLVAQCMKEKQFFPVIKRLFQKQLEWVQAENLPIAIYNILKPLGIKEKKVMSCLENNEENKIRWQYIAEARKIAMDERNIESTPTFFVNGKKIEGKFDINTIKEISIVDEKINSPDEKIKDNWFTKLINKIFH